MNLRSLIAKLDECCRTTLEGAAGFCLSRTHYNVEIEHWLIKILDQADTDLHAIAREYEMQPADWTAELLRAVDRLKTGNARPPALSPSLVELAREAWLVASLDYEAAEARSGHVLLALLTKDSLSRQVFDSCPSLEKIPVDALRNRLAEICSDTSEAKQSASKGAGAAAAGTPAAPKKGGALDQFTIDLTASARAGEIDPVLGRDMEIRQVIDILTRRRQNNPILTGEAGVGKTAVVEGFALRIAEGDVPEALRNVAVHSLDLALLQAGAGVKGEFENRLKGVIAEVKASPTPIILFIDEAHTLIGAGGSAGQGDAANLLKPALARGELRTIAATTWAEYKKFFERDAALTRRFQVVKIEEPSEDIAIQIMRGLVGVMEAHHGVRITDEAARDSVRLSSRYLSGRQLPDKSVSVLDTACARVALSQSSTPAAIEDCQRNVTRIDTALRMIDRERAAGPVDEEECEELRAERQTELQRAEALDERWQRERAIVQRCKERRDRLEGVTPLGSAVEENGSKEAPLLELTSDERETLVADLQKDLGELRALQGESPLIHPWVDAQAIAEVISNWTGIPVGRMVSDEVKTILSLEDRLRERVVGQDHALAALAQRIQTSRANLTDPNRPIGVFMLVGTSGVGKTETAVSLAELLYGGEQNMTVINMTEFKEEHKVSLLMGSPPGYVGYGEGGILTEAVRRKPYSVVLLDELEKSHPGVQDVFYQVFDKGTLKDGEGRDIDFRNTVILMTTNAGTDTIMSLMADPETMPDADGLAAALRPELLKTFKPAFLGRTTLLPYFPLSDEVLRGIVGLKLKKIVARVAENYSAEMSFTEEVVASIAGRCTEVESGARNIDHILNGTLLPEMAAEFLQAMSEGKAIRGVEVSIAENGGFTYALQC